MEVFDTHVGNLFSNVDIIVQRMQQVFTCRQPETPAVQRALPNACVREIRNTALYSKSHIFCPQPMY